MRLVQDLAVGVDPDGADAWVWQDLLADGFSIGAPPDEFEPDGQSWGLPPWIPWRLRDAGYRPLAALLRAAMVAGGGLRIDHVMGLTRLFWVPEGGDPADGAYVRFAGHELLELVALESARAEAIVVGEDLGTVEEGLREELAPPADPVHQVVWFEDEPPERVARRSRSPWSPPTTSRPSPAMCRGTDAPPRDARAASSALGRARSTREPRRRGRPSRSTTGSAAARPRSPSPPSRTSSGSRSARTSPAPPTTSARTGRSPSPSPSTTSPPTPEPAPCSTRWPPGGGLGSPTVRRVGTRRCPEWESNPH